MNPKSRTQLTKGLVKLINYVAHNKSVHFDTIPFFISLKFKLLKKDSDLFRP